MTIRQHLKNCAISYVRTQWVFGILFVVGGIGVLLTPRFNVSDSAEVIVARVRIWLVVVATLYLGGAVGMIAAAIIAGFKVHARSATKEYGQGSDGKTARFVLLTSIPRLRLRSPLPSRLEIVVPMNSAYGHARFSGASMIPVRVTDDEVRGQLEKWVRLLGWRFRLRALRHGIGNDAPRELQGQIIKWYEAGKATGRRDHCCLQINEDRGRAGKYFASRFSRSASGYAAVGIAFALTGRTSSIALPRRPSV